jgi:hypothetical protein
MKMFIRDQYKPLIDSDISTKNEPCVDRIMTINAKLYPDMYKAYQSFSKLFNMPIGNFILTNGCENALKIALLALRVKDITLEKPTWGMVQVDCEALDIAYDFCNYEYKNGVFVPEKKNICTKFLYTTDAYNNFFKHRDISFNSGVTTILDETYTARQLLANKKNIADNTIIIGSFSKTVGAGLRLGYCLFSERWKERFQLLREQYVSAAACQWLDSAVTLCINDSPIEDIPYEIVSQHPVYITVKAKALPIPHKHFKVSGVDFCRFDRKAMSWQKTIELLREYNYERETV